MSLGEYEKAEQYFYQWQNAGPEGRFSNHIMNYGIGYVYSQLGKTEEADKAFTEEIQKLESDVTRQIKLYDKLRALESLARHTGCYEQDNRQKQIPVINFNLIDSNPKIKDDD